ncbi:MAG: nucleotidyl transferase AbiEii/AbiGii toxin family protein [Fimbriimonadaceae bacterium]
MPETPDLAVAAIHLIAALESAKFEYAIIGGLAVIVSGYNRFTEDIDAVVWDLDDRLDELVTVLETHGFSFRIPDGARNARQIRLLRMKDEAGVEVDLSMGFLPFEYEVITRASVMKLGDAMTARIASVEDLVIMKLVASRNRDLDDVTRLLELYPVQNKARIRRIVKDYADVLERPEILKNLKARVK